MIKSLTITDNEYKQWISELNNRYRRSQLKAAVKVNSEVLRFYWSLGKDIVDMQAEERWGEGFMTCLSRDLKREISDAASFSTTNLYYIKKFYLFYCENIAILPQLGVKIGAEASNEILPHAEVKIEDPLAEEILSLPWGHHKLLIDKFFKKCELNQALFYIHKCIQDGWSRSVLLNFIDTDLYDRQGKAATNFALTLPNPQSDLAQEAMRDPYCFDFTKLREPYNERILKNALIKNIEKFLLELGTGFAYMGREYRLRVGNKDQYADMLFYNVNLRSYIVIECKTSELTSADIGQLGGYVVAVDHILRKPEDNKTIGLLICKTKDQILARYALESSSQPLAVSEYELEKFYPQRLEGIIPSIDEIERHLEETIKPDNTISQQP